MDGITVSVDTSGLERMKSLIGHIPGALKKVERGMMRELARSAKKIAAEESSKVYYIQRGRVTRAITTQGMSLVVLGRRQNVADYRMTPKVPGKRRKNGIRVGVMRAGGLKNIPHGFVIRGKNSGKILGVLRTGRGRKVFHALISPAIPQMMENPEVQSAMMERLNRSAIEAMNLYAGKILAGR